MKISPLIGNDFEVLIGNIIDRHKNLSGVSILDIEEILKLNGIIFVHYIPGRKKKYTFAYLYKYYLGLRTPRKRRLYQKEEG